MMEQRGEWFAGAHFDDLAEYLRSADGDYPANRVEQSRCTCGHTAFQLEIDDEQGCARRTCLSCRAIVLIADSAEYWDDADPGAAQCPCGEERFEVGVGFSLLADDDIYWITVAARCLGCGVMAVYADWKIDYTPTQHLFSAV
jgi:hypothetical protein